MVHTGDHVRDHLRFTSGIICGLESFALQFGDHFSGLGIIRGPIWGSFAVEDHELSGVVWGFLIPLLALWPAFACSEQAETEIRLHV